MSKTPPNPIRQGGNQYAVREAAKRFARVIEELVPDGDAKRDALSSVEVAAARACDGINGESSDV